MRDQLTDRVIAMVAETVQQPPEAISAESSFEELGIDSLGAVALVADIEEAWGVSIPNDDVLRIRSVGEAVACLRQQLPAGGGATA